MLFFTRTLTPHTHAARGGGLAEKWKPWSKMHFKLFEALLANVVFLPPPLILPEGGGGGGGACLIRMSIQFSPLRF